MLDQHGLQNGLKKILSFKFLGQPILPSVTKVTFHCYILYGFYGELRLGFVDKSLYFRQANRFGLY